MHEPLDSTLLDSPLARQERLEFACAAFESEWQSGRRPLLADHLARAPESDRVELLAEFLAIDVHHRSKGGDRPTADDYVNALSDYGEPIRRFFDAATEPLNIPGFIVERELGRGGMGVVYLAKQSRPKRRVAIKVLRDGAADDQRLHRRFRNEWNAVARLQHANIMAVYSVGEVDGQPYMAVEYAAGGMLDKHLAGKPMPWRSAAKLVQTLAWAMAHAHERGVIHRDLKPANVLLVGADANGPPSTPKIADFGLAKVLAEPDAEMEKIVRPPVNDDLRVTTTGEAMGTPSYMAPEQASVAGDVGPWTDVYALGAILYEVLTGRPPFRGPTVSDTLQQVMTQEPVTPRLLQPSVPHDLENICLKCLNKEPAARYPTAKELAEDLGRLQAGETVTARTPPWPERARRWIARHPNQVVVMTSLTLLTVAMSIAYWRLNVAWRAEQAAVNDVDSLNKELSAGGTLGLLKSTNANPQEKEAFVARIDRLESAVARAEPLLASDTQRLGLLPALAKGYDELGRLRSRVGQTQAARHDTHRAVELYEGLTRIRPDQVDYRIDLARSLVHRARINHNPNRKEDVKGDLTSAEAIAREIIRTGNAPALAYVALGETLFYQAEFRLTHIGFLAADDALQTAWRLRPDDHRVRAATAIVVQRIGTFSGYAMDSPGARARFQSAIDRLSAIADAHPDDLDVQQQLATLHINASHGLNRLHIDSAPSAGHANKAISLLDAMIKRQDVASYRWYRALAIGNRGDASELAGDLAAADADGAEHIGEIDRMLPAAIATGSLAHVQWARQGYLERVHFWFRRGALDEAEQSVVKLEATQAAAAKLGDTKDEYPLTAICCRALVLDRRGHYPEAAALLEQLPRTKEGDWAVNRSVRLCAARAGAGECRDEDLQAAKASIRELPDGQWLYWHELARAYARLSRRADDAALREAHAGSALECLRLARGKGSFVRLSFNPPPDKDPDFAGLRERPEFKALVGG